MASGQGVGHQKAGGDSAKMTDDIKAMIARVRELDGILEENWDIDIHRTLAQGIEKRLPVERALRSLRTLAPRLADELEKQRVAKQVERELRRAADLRIVELRDENARLREALKIALTYGLPPEDVSGSSQWAKARAALEGKGLK